MKPEMLAQAYADILGGATPRADLDYETVERDIKKPNDLEVTLITDLSGSMRGEKAAEQTKTAVLIMEALAEFEDELKRERAERAVDLRVSTELRGFGSDEFELKALSDTLPFKARIAAMRAMHNPNGSATNDFLSLGAVLKQVDEEKKKKMGEDAMRKLVILVTDGESSNESAAKRAKDALAASGVIAKALQIGSVTEEEWNMFHRVWGNDGAHLGQISELPTRVEELLKDFLNKVF